MEEGGENRLDTLDTPQDDQQERILKNNQDSSKRLFIKIPSNQHHHRGTTQGS